MDSTELLPDTPTVTPILTPTPPSVEVDPKVCLTNNSCWWLLGVNYPWLHYGHDFGQAAWPNGSWTYDGAASAASRQHIEQDFTYLKSKGVHVIRWFLFADGRSSPEFDADGNVTGFDEYFYDDLRQSTNKLLHQPYQYLLLLLYLVQQLV